MKRTLAIRAGLAAFFVLPVIGGLPAAFAQGAATWSEYYHVADAVVVVKPVIVQPPTTTDDVLVETVRIIRDRTGSLKEGSRLSLSAVPWSTSDGRMLLFGWKADNEAYRDLLLRSFSCGNCRSSASSKPEFKGVRWHQCGNQELSPSAIRYVTESPSPDIAIDKRLEYFAKFVESEESAVSADAFSEFANALDELTFRLPATLRPAQIRRWLLDPKTPVRRVAVFGVMLGLCGGPEDADVLKRRIADPDDDHRFGIEGVMAGYLLLNGESALTFLESTKLADPKASDEETYAAVLAIRYLRRHGNGKIAPDRLNAAMKLLLDKPMFIESAVIDLARAKDWTLHERLMHVYRVAGDDDRPQKRAIIQYMIASTKDIARNANEPPVSARVGQECLNEIRRRDPKLVAEAEKYFLVP